MTKARLQAVLAKAGITSRRKATGLIESGLVRVNGRIVSRKGFRVDTSKDKITVDGKPVSFGRARCYYVLNKPAGVLSTSRDERGRKTVLDCVRDKERRLYPVGRLDKDTTGLIILTDDGDLTYRLTHPKFEIERVYQVGTKGAVSGEDLLRLKDGVIIEGKAARAEKIFLTKKSPRFTSLLVTLREGRKREVRRMFEAVGHRVVKLKRVAYGPLKLGDLKEGEYRALTACEVAKLKA